MMESNLSEDITHNRVFPERLGVSIGNDDHKKDWKGRGWHPGFDLS